MPEVEVEEVREVFRAYGLTERRAPRWCGAPGPPKAWVDFMMRFELGLEKPDPHARSDSA